MRHLIGVALAVLAGAVGAAQAPRPVTLLSEVRSAIAAHDLARAEALVSRQRADKGNTPEVLEASSWLARGAQSCSSAASSTRTDSVSDENAFHKPGPARSVSCAC
jgi:hypothetical protein